jgi:nitroreductase
MVYSLIFWRTSLGEVLSKIYDIRLHLIYCFNNEKLSDKENLHYFLTKQYHIIEKGLALPKPREAFGQAKIKQLLGKANIYVDKYGQCQLIFSIKSCLQAYLAFNDNSGAILEKNFRTEIEVFISKVHEIKPGGVKTIAKQDITKHSSIDFEGFIRHRFSVRDFSKNKVEPHLIFDAVELAKFAPSVCNRQGWKVHLYTGAKLMKELLLIQNGNGGFTDSVKALLIVTGDIKAFTRYESNQIFTDGGLFSMNLMFSLHHKGLGTCPLNTCFPYVVERKVKQLAGIPTNERLVMMLAVGHLKDEFKVAISERKVTNEILVEH